MTASMTHQGLFNCMLVPSPGSDLVKARFFFSFERPVDGLCNSDGHHHGRFSLRILHILLPTSIPGVAHALFPCLMTFSYTLLPSILYIFCLLAQVSPSPSFGTFFNLFFFPLLFFFLHIFYITYRDTYATVPIARCRRTIFANHHTHEPLVQTSLSNLKEFPLSISLSSCDSHSQSRLPLGPSIFIFFFFSSFVGCLFFFKILSL